MSGQPYRTRAGARIDRTRTIGFSFDGRHYAGHPGDTLASALLANGVRLTGRSFKYHRPRGLMAAGVEEPSSLVEVGAGGRKSTNLRATEVELFDGLGARSLNRWPSLGLDLLEVNSLLGRFLAAGFYYKTFMWPHWHLFEWAIRRAAGIGRPATEPDPDRYEFRHAHCDVLVVGSGPAGLAAARAAAGDGVHVMLVEQDSDFGGSLLWRDAEIDGEPAEAWRARVLAELDANPDVTRLSRTTANAYYDHNEVALIERAAPGAAGAHERLWQVRAKRVVLAAGALERPLVFPGNDRPGVMLASAAQQYAARFGALPGRRVMVFTNNDTAYEACRTLRGLGCEIAAVVDSRAAPPADLVEPLRAAGIRVEPGAVVCASRGHAALSAVRIRRTDGSEHELACDALLMSGGWNPTVHLFSQSGGKAAYDDARAAFVPAVSVQAEQSVGAANGTFALAAALREGHAAGAAAARAGGMAPSAAPCPAAPETTAPGIEPLWQVKGRGKAFVDFQNDVTTSDIALAARENFVSVEHLKRYTTLGMAVDQGKTSGVNALAIMGELTGRSPGGVGTTRYRPPFTPVSLAAFAGRARGELFRPFRHSPMHDWHVANGAEMEDFGGWFRPAWYRRGGEDRERAMAREARAVREAAGLFDSSSLGKIEVCGPDAAVFLDRIYANTMSTLAVGRVRYGLMLNELGVIIDDGVCARLGEDRFLVGATSSGAAKVAAWLEEWRQCEWPDLKVLTAPVTADWGVAALTGPKARAILAAAGTDIDLSPDAFPHMSLRTGQVAGVPARVARVSFTGEVSYEINVPTDRLAELWDALLAAGAPHGLQPVGIDAWMLLRTEKGYLHVGADTDGTTLPADVGWKKVSGRKLDFVGKRSLLWEVNRREDRLQFVGLEALDTAEELPVGAHVRAAKGGAPSEGFVTSTGFSPILDRPVALGLVKGGRGRMGEVFELAKGGGRVRVVHPAAYDPEGERLNG